MAANPDTPEGDRALWIQLADELDARLNEPGADPDRQPSLFEEMQEEAERRARANPGKPVFWHEPETSRRSLEP